VFGRTLNLVERPMTESRSGSVARNRRVLARVVLVAACVGAVFAAFPDAASAERAGARVARAVWQAPVGHRQPRPDELPRKNEGAVTPAEKDFDKSLKICRGC
jgi:hypothetical protein